VSEQSLDCEESHWIY